MCRVTNQIIDTIGKAYRIDDHDIVIGMSAGIGLYPNDGTDAKTLLHHADIAIVWNKGIQEVMRYKSPWQLWNVGITQQFSNRFKIELINPPCQRFG